MTWIHTDGTAGASWLVRRAWVKFGFQLDF